MGEFRLLYLLCMLRFPVPLHSLHKASSRSQAVTHWGAIEVLQTPSLPAKALKTQAGKYAMYIMA
jgi:hypothetical protein